MSQTIETFDDGRAREPNASVTSIEAMITRLVDGEAADEERARFEALAAREPSLWRHLALAHQDMVCLSMRVDREIADVDRINLPAQRSSGLSLRAIAPWAGWAAAAVLGFVAFTGMDREGAGQLAMNDPSNVVKQSVGAQGNPDQHLQEYLDAPFVLGEMPAELLEVQEMTDGRYALRILRQIEEVAFVASAEQVPVDVEGHLALPPEDLRRFAPAVEVTN